MGTWTLLPFSGALYNINGVFWGIVSHFRLLTTITFSGGNSLLQYRSLRKYVHMRDMCSDTRRILRSQNAVQLNATSISHMDLCGIIVNGDTAGLLIS